MLRRFLFTAFALLVAAGVFAQAEQDPIEQMYGGGVIDGSNFNFQVFDTSLDYDGTRVDFRYEGPPYILCRGSLPDFVLSVRGGAKLGNVTFNVGDLVPDPWAYHCPDAQVSIDCAYNDEWLQKRSGSAETTYLGEKSRIRYKRFDARADCIVEIDGKVGTSTARLTEQHRVNH
jgi:hypothetical protein